MINKYIVVLISLAMLTGCITSRSPDCYGYNTQLPNGKEKKSIAYSFLRTGNISIDKEFDPISSRPAFAGGWVGAQPEPMALSQFKGIFEPAANVITPTTDRNGGLCDIMLTIHQQNAFNPLGGIPALISGFTLLFVPCWGDDVYYLNVKASNNKTGLKKEYLIKRNITTSCWLPFILAMPFSEMPMTAMDHITKENWKELRCKMEDDGFFDVIVSTNSLPNENLLNQLVDDSAKRFMELKKLKEQGILTNEEFQKAIERIK